MAATDNMNDLWSQWTEQCINESLANVRRFSRLPLLWSKSQGVKKGASASEVVYEHGNLKLLHYINPGPLHFSTPQLFVFALVNRPYILDLKPGKSVVEHYVNRGFDTYLIDWGIPTEADRHLSLDDYINGSLLNVVQFLCERCHVPQVNVLGYCMGGTMSAIFTSLHQELVKSLTLLAAGIDFSVKEGLLQLWSSPEYFDVDRFVDVFGNASPAFLQAGFLMLKPIQNLIEKPINLWERMDDEKFLEDYFAMEAWLGDNIPVAGEVYREFIKYLYQQNRLVKGELPIGRHTVNLRNITCPVLNIVARNDDLVPPCQSLPFNDLVGSTDRKLLQLNAGHIGLAVGSKAQSELWPAAVAWLAERSAGAAPNN